jgi:hypothetical protein
VMDMHLFAYASGVSSAKLVSVSVIRRR